MTDARKRLEELQASIEMDKAIDSLNLDELRRLAHVQQEIIREQRKLVPPPPEPESEWDEFDAGPHRPCEEHDGPGRVVIKGMAHQCLQCMFIMCAECRQEHATKCFARKYNP